MAYRNLVAQAIATRAELFKRFRDFVCRRNGSYDYSTTGIGWTLHDSYYAVDENTISTNDWFVIYSPGEDGKKDLYWHVLFTSTGYIQFRMHQYWNASTNAGVNSQPATNNWTVADATTGNLYIYGNLDKIIAFALISTSKYAILFGLVDDSVFGRTVATSTAAVSAGSSVVVTLDVVPSDWAVGRKVVVRDNANMEFIVISNISGLDVTFTTIVASYSAGCKFASDYPVYSQSSSIFGSGGYLQIGHSGSKMVVNYAVSPSLPTTFADPDPLNSDYIVSPLEISDVTTGYIGRFLDIFIGSNAYTHLGIYTAGGVNYRAFVDTVNTFHFLIKEV